MNGLSTVRRRFLTRVAIVVAVLLFSATAVEVAPIVTDALADLGWISDGVPDVIAPAAANASTAGDFGRGATATDDAALGRLVQFASAQPGTAFIDATNADVAPSISDPSIAGLVSGADFGTSPELMVTFDATDESLGIASQIRGSAQGSSTEAGTIAGDSQNEFTDGGSGESTNVADGTAAPSSGNEVAAIVIDAPSTAQILDFAAIDPSFGSGLIGSFAPMTNGDLPASAPNSSGVLDLGATAEAAAVPEPATLFLLGSGLIGLAVYRRRKTAG